MIGAAEYRRQALDALRKVNTGPAITRVENAVREDLAGAATGMVQKSLGMLGK